MAQDELPSPMRIAGEIFEGLVLYIRGTQTEADPHTMTYRVEIADVAAGEGPTPLDAARNLRLALQVLQQRKAVDCA